MNILDMPVSPRLLLWGPLLVLGGYVGLFRLYSVTADARTRRKWLERKERMMEEAQEALVSKNLLTPNEQEFYGRLEKASEGLGLQVVPQVAMGALLDVNLEKTHPLYWPIRRQFSGKIVDFVVYVKGSMRVLAIVELDDRTHDPEKDRKRDAMMAKAGFRTVRWDSRAKPTVQAIKDKFSELISKTSI